MKDGSIRVLITNQPNNNYSTMNNQNGNISFNAEKAGEATERLINKNCIFNSGLIHPIQLAQILDFLNSHYEAFKINTNDIGFFDLFLILNIHYLRSKKVPFDAIAAMIEAGTFTSQFASGDGYWFSEVKRAYNTIWEASRETPTNLNSYYRKNNVISKRKWLNG